MRGDPRGGAACEPLDAEPLVRLGEDRPLHLPGQKTLEPIVRPTTKIRDSVDCGRRKRTMRIEIAKSRRAGVRALVRPAGFSEHPFAFPRTQAEPRRYSVRGAVGCTPN